MNELETSLLFLIDCSVGGFRRLRAAGTCGIPPRGPNDLSFCEKKGLLDFQRKKAHRQTAIFYFRRASGYTRSIHRPLPLPFRLKKCQYPHWAAAALLAGGQPPWRWRKAIETAQGSGSGKRGFACSQTGRRSIKVGAVPMGPNFSLGSQRGFLFRKKETPFGPVAEPQNLVPVAGTKSAVAGATRSPPPAGGEIPCARARKPFSHVRGSKEERTESRFQPLPARRDKIPAPWGGQKEGQMLQWDQKAGERAAPGLEKEARIWNTLSANG